MVTLVRSIAELEKLETVQEARSSTTKKIGLVPTMGNLHQGHINLLKASVEDCDISILSVFVNPTQFGEGEDFQSYPRTLESDLEKVSRVDGTIIVWAPEISDIYGENIESNFQAGDMGKMLEGNVRPGHFEGVLTVVHKLFDLTKPDQAYFGKKDYQQWRLIDRHAKKYFPRLLIKPIEIEREQSGLAMSSRNGYLSSDQKEEALELYRCLSQVEKIIRVEKDLRSALEFIQKKLDEDERFNYLSIRKQNDLTPPLDLSEPLVILGNFQIGTTRLLDNIEVSF